MINLLLLSIIVYCLVTRYGPWTSLSAQGINRIGKKINSQPTIFFNSLMFKQKRQELKFSFHFCERFRTNKIIKHKPFSSKKEPVARKCYEMRDADRYSPEIELNWTFFAESGGMNSHVHVARANRSNLKAPNNRE